VFVRFLPEPVQDSVCLGDVLDRFCVLPLLLCRRLVSRHICPLWPILPRQSFDPLPDEDAEDVFFHPMFTEVELSRDIAVA